MIITRTGNYPTTSDLKPHNSIILSPKYTRNIFVKKNVLEKNSRKKNIEQFDKVGN